MSKKLITTNITASAKMPIRKMTLDHVQEAYTEMVQSLCRAIGTDDAGGTPGTPAYDILYGLESTTVGSAFSCNRGAVYTGGEIFLVSASSFTIGAGEYPIFVLATSYASGDPTEFTDGNTYNVHQIRRLNVISGTTATANYAGTFSAFTNKLLPTTVTNTSGITYGANITSAQSVHAKRDHLGVVVMQGACVMNSSFAVGQTILTLPATHKPVLVTGANPRIGVTIVNGASFGTLYIEFTSTGAVSAAKDPSGLIGNNAIIYFDNVVFYNV